MIKIRIIVVGKDKDRWIEEGCAHFEKLLGRYAEISWAVVPSEKASKNISAAEIKKHEASRVIKSLDKGLLIALADFGTRLDSRQFARNLEQWQVISGGRISFVIGGAYGLDETILSHADNVISLSPLTFSHQLVRLVLLEQLYRGFTILANTGYHK